MLIFNRHSRLYHITDTQSQDDGRLVDIPNEPPDDRCSFCNIKLTQDEMQYNLSSGPFACGDDWLCTNCGYRFYK